MRIRAHLPSTWRAPGFEVALGWLWCGLGVALVEPWWSLGGALVEPWWSLGGALVEPWWSLGGALVWLCTPESMPSIWPCGGLVVALKWLWVALPGISAFCHRFQGACGRSLLRPAGRPWPAPDARRSAFPSPPLLRDRESWLRAGRGQRINDASGKCKLSQNRWSFDIRPVPRRPVNRWGHPTSAHRYDHSGLWHQPR